MKISAIFQQQALRHILYYVLIALLYVILIIFTEKQLGKKVYHRIQVAIATDSKYQNHFLDKNDILQFLKLKHQGFEQTAQEIDLKQLEKMIHQSPYVENAEVWLDWSGQLCIDVRLERPVLRLIRNNKQDLYITENAKCMPVSPKYTARVLVVEGSYLDKMIQHDTLVQEGLLPYLGFVKTLQADKFWNTLIAQVRVNREGEMILYPQIGKQIIEFGKPENVSYKLKKLGVFYQKILRMKGWNYYSTINIKHTNQIICKK